LFPLLAQLVLHFGERLHPRVFVRLDLDDVVTVLRFHQVADHAGFEGEGRLFEFRHHLSARHPAQVSALRARPGVF
jgi:hypothetical protein